MARTIKAIQTQTPAVGHQPAWKMSLPVSKACQLYPRVSTPAQKKNVSAEMQQDKAFALSCGWPQEMVIVDDRDLGVSGQLRMEDRLAFTAMNERIVQGEIGAVVVAAVDRLFPEKWGVEYSKFMELCERYGVLVVTLEFVYDFRVNWHIDRFRTKCVEAWNFVDQHVNGRMLPARDHMGQRGFWAAGNIAVGYTVDRDVKYKKYIIYPPHAEKIVLVFQTFRECGGVLSETYRRLEARGFLFPPFDASIDPELHGRIALKKVADGEGKIRGYRFASLTGLTSVLSNPAYIGAWLFKGQIVYGNHPAIVEKELFLYAYSILSPLTLSGEVNTQKRREGYIKRANEDGAVLLKSVIVSGDGPGHKIYPDKYPSTASKSLGEMIYTYKVCKDTGNGCSTGVGRYPASVIDALVMGKLVEMLQATEAFSNYAAIDTREAEHESVLTRIKAGLMSAKAAMKRNEGILLSGAITALDLLSALNTAQEKLAADVLRLAGELAALEEHGSDSSRRLYYHDLVTQVGQQWRKFEASLLAEMIQIFLERVILTRVSTSLYTIEIVWSDPEWPAVQALCLHEAKKKAEWDALEDALLREMYPQCPIEEVLEALPDRTLHTIRTRASAKGIRRQVRGEKVSTDTLTFADQEELEKRGLSWQPCGSQLTALRSGILEWSYSSSLQFSRTRPFDLEQSISRLRALLAA